MNKPIFNRYLSFKNPQIQNKKNLSFDNFLKKENKNSYLNQFEIKLNSQSNKKEKKIFSNSKKSNNSNSPHLSIAFGKCYNSSNSEKNNSINSLQKKSFTSAKKINFSSFANANEKISKMSFLGKKKKILSSEEIELEKIKKEKEELKKQKLINQKCYLKSKNYIPMIITPSPLTIIQPFNLSNNYTSKLLKSKINEIECENYKIKKIKVIQNKFTDEKDIINENNLNNKINENENNINIFNTPPKNIEILNYKEDKNINLDENKNQNIINVEKDLSLTSRIKKYYEVTKDILDKQRQDEENLNNINNKID